MAISNEKFGFVLRDATTGLPSSGQLVELREGANNYVLIEKATSGFYEVASIPTGKYSAWVNSVDSGSTFGVGTGQVAALGNTLDSVAVSTASEFGFQAPAVFKATLDLDLVTNKAIPLAVAADENKIISVNASGNYVLTAPSSTGFTAVFEANSASELEAALAAPLAEKTIINTKASQGYNYFTSKNISVYGVNKIYGADIDFSCQTGIIVNFVSDATDPLQPQIDFFNTTVLFGYISKFVGAIEPIINIRNVYFNDAQIDIGGGGVALFYEKLLFTGTLSGTKPITQSFWDNTFISSGGGGQVDSVIGGNNITVDATDPINPTVNLDSSIIGMTVNGVTLSNVATAGTFLDNNGNYSTPTTVTPALHASTHVSGGTDIIRDATASLNGLATPTQITKLDGIEALADVTDTTNVTSAGALMDSEVINLSQVKAFDSTDYATSAQGTLADNALPTSGGAMTGAITTNSTFDGRDVSVDGTKLDTIETNADVTDALNVNAAGATMNNDTDISFNGWVISENDMVSNTITKVPTQQSVKAYTDTGVASLLTNNQTFTGINTFSQAILATKGVKPRIGTDTSTSSLTVDASLFDQYNITALALGLSINAPTNPTDGQRLVIRFKDDATTRSLNWFIATGGFRALGTTLPTNTTASKTIYVGCIYNLDDNIWDVVAVSEEA
jgi:hypothetical protein